MIDTERRWKLGGYEAGKVRGLEFGVGNAERQEKM